MSGVPLVDRALQEAGDPEVGTRQTPRPGPRDPRGPAQENGRLSRRHNQHLQHVHERVRAGAGPRQGQPGVLQRDEVHIRQPARAEEQPRQPGHVRQHGRAGAVAVEAEDRVHQEERLLHMPVHSGHHPVPVGRVQRGREQQLAVRVGPAGRHHDVQGVVDRTAGAVVPGHAEPQRHPDSGTVDIRVRHRKRLGRGHR